MHFFLLRRSAQQFFFAKSSLKHTQTLKNKHKYDKEPNKIKQINKLRIFYKYLRAFSKFFLNWSEVYFIILL